MSFDELAKVGRFMFAHPAEVAAARAAADYEDCLYRIAAVGASHAAMLSYRETVITIAYRQPWFSNKAVVDAGLQVAVDCAMRGEPLTPANPTAWAVDLVGELYPVARAQGLVLNLIARDHDLVRLMRICIDVWAEPVPDEG